METVSVPGLTFSDGASAHLTIDYTPAPVPVSSVLASTLFGDTSRNITNAAGMAAADANYGKGDVFRVFDGDVLTAPPGSDRKFVGSFKNMSGYDPKIAALYWRLILMHEIDRPGRMDPAVWHADMDQLVKTGHPGLSVCVTADVFVNPNKNPATWLVPGVSHWTVDCDGISHASTPYPDYSRQMLAMEAFAKQHGLTLGIGEFATNRALNDVDGSQRAAWLLAGGKRFRDAGMEFCCVWEQDSWNGAPAPLIPFTTPAERAAVHALLMLG